MRKITILILVFAIAGCARLRPHPKPWDKTDKVLAGYFLAGHAADAYTTEKFLDYPDRFYEKNPVLGKHPRDEEVVIYFAVTALVVLWIAHLYPELRPWILGAYGSVGLYWAHHNYHLVKDRHHP